jgi:hypothetical protein
MRRVMTTLCTSALAALVAVAAAPIAYAGPDVDDAVDALGQLTLASFTGTPRSVPAGATITLQWRITGTTPAQIRLDGGLVGKTGSQAIQPDQRDETHTLTASYLGAIRTMGKVVVGVNPCADPTPDPEPAPPPTDGPGLPPGPGQQIPPTGGNAPTRGQCSRIGSAHFSYERVSQRMSYRSNELSLTPRSGVVKLNACTTDPGIKGRIERYEWTITPTDSPSPSRVISTDQCETAFSPISSGNPPYIVELVARGAINGDLRYTTIVQVRDLFVVSLGDSMASGEGNPDDPGDYIPNLVIGAHWKHSACHRSARSGHAKAAKAIDAMDKRTGLVFLSLACSGANVDDLVSRSHSGQPPQLTELRDALCDYDCDRQIDVLMLTVGINHLGFADVVQNCKIIASAACINSVAYAADYVGIVSDKLRTLRDRIAALGLDVRRVLITEYPANIFDNGCAYLSSQIGQVGAQLNQEISSSAASFGWGYVGGIVSGFQGHNYCADDTYFRSFTESLDMQGDVEGTAHPNGTGHSVIATRIASRYAA